MSDKHNSICFRQLSRFARFLDQIAKIDLIGKRARSLPFTFDTPEQKLIHVENFFHNEKSLLNLLVVFCMEKIIQLGQILLVTYFSVLPKALSYNSIER